MLAAQHTAELMKHLWAVGGLAGLWHGLSVSLGYVMVYINANQAVLAGLNTLFPTDAAWVLAHSRRAFLLKDALLSSVSGLVATLIAKPLQVVRTRMLAALLPQALPLALSPAASAAASSGVAAAAAATFVRRQSLAALAAASRISASTAAAAIAADAGSWPCLGAWATAGTIVAEAGASGLFAGLLPSLAGVLAQQFAYVVALDALDSAWSFLAPYFRSAQWNELSALEQETVVAGERSAMVRLVHTIGLVAMYPFEVIARRQALTYSSRSLIASPELRKRDTLATAWATDGFSLLHGFVFSQMAGWY